MEKVLKGFKSLPRSQVSDDLLWQINGNNNCFLRKSQGLTLSADPCNLSGLNLKRDSGVTSQEGMGITLNKSERKIKDKKSKKRANVLRFDFNLRSRRNLGKEKLVKVTVQKNNTLKSNANRAYSTSAGLTTRAIVKVVKRGLKTYRPDLHNIALEKLRLLHKAKKVSKNISKREARSKK